MPEDAQIRWQALPPLLLLILLAAGSFWWFPYPLSGERLPQPYVAGTPLERVQQTEARLWQDPFTAVQRSQERQQSQVTASDDRPKRSLDWLNKLAQEKCADTEICHVLGIMVFGGPYMGAQEFRRATRYSVLAGLSRQGFIPEDTEHIGWIDPRAGQESPEGDMRRTLPSVMPFEWLSRTAPGARKPVEPLSSQMRGDRLLLLWLDEDALTRDFYVAAESPGLHTKMLPRLTELLRPFLDANGRYAVQIIGPASSGTLAKLATEWLEIGSQPDEASSHGSPTPAEAEVVPEDTPARSESNLPRSGRSATADLLPTPVDAASAATGASAASAEQAEKARQPDRQARSDPRESLRPVRWLSATATSSAAWQKAKKAKKDGLSIKRIIATDEALAELLVSELQRRGLRPADTVALVGQIDTAYSRDLIAMLQEQLAAVFRYGNVQIVTAHYFRGIDGNTPGGSDDAGHGVDESARGNKTPNADQVERPEGQSQVDYLRRLTSELARQHQAYKPGGEIRAIGVLGDDYHDKLLVLKALRRAFPDAVFFTTDLDAAMLHPIDNRETRNLIVASAFGLELEPALQAGVAPFRTSYRTATYLATRLALEQPARQSEAASDEERLIDSQKAIDKRIGPLLFEIGRTEPIRLNNPTTPRGAPAGDQGTGCGPRKQDWTACLDWQPARYNRPQPSTVLGLVVAAIGALTLSAQLSKRFRRFLLGHWRTFALGAALAGLLIAALISGLPSPLGEPFSWVEGVSIWPTEILRLAAVTLAVTLFFAGIRHLRLSDQAIHERFFRETPTDEAAAAAVSKDDGRVSGHDIWQLYRARQFSVGALSRLLADGHTNVVPSWLTRHFVLRNLKPVGLYLLIGFGLTMALGRPETPARGELAFVVDCIILIASILSFLMLLFFALEASRRSVWLIRSLTERSSWPDLTLKRFGWQQGLDRRPFDDYLDVQLIADATQGLQPLVYYPFLVFFLLVLSRTTLFDGWHIPLALYIIFGVAALLMLIAAVRVRSVAKAARGRSLDRINRLVIESQARHDGEATLAPIQQIRSVVQGIRRGAYSPLMEEPIIRAILGLASGIYAIAFVEWRSVAGM